MDPESQIGHGHVQRRGPPHELHGLVQEQDDPERGEDLVEVIPVVEMAEDEHFEDEAEGKGAGQRQEERSARSFRSRR